MLSPNIIVKILGEIDGYWNPVIGGPAAGLLYTINAQPLLNFTTATTVPSTLVNNNADRVIRVHNMNQNLLVVGNFYVAHLVNNFYVINNQATFLEFQ